ncbi:MAG: hypothetical protein UY08_C0002G0009 [Candidatus Gottesmanbacteria bacterium GW2011_GWA1_47_8]|uniref:DUF2283 domain-containing protein n=3 Tax=Candidatus Gottesmaniibacteriota TaxID=1752720 RepID=A0A0G1TH69_9BACT|nr:MAG: hypothetical protein UY08_C0002G0009 [Candidatus Gottesmanbacteria bacterium GW2011_GWA1_47_8]
MDMKQKPKVYYDQKVDALWIRVKKGPEADSAEIAPGLTVEYNAKGDIIGLEILNASSVFNAVKTRSVPQEASYA